jgi:curli biogenesis system outer membrane secretion channel CsgG
MKKIKVTKIKNVYKLFMLFVLFLIICLTAGCATSINVKVQHPPNLNTAGIRRIAVMPFENKASNRDMAQYATSVAVKKVQETNYFTLVAASEVDRLRNNNQSLENYVDAMLTGQITRINTTNNTYHGTYKTKDGKTVNYIDYTTSVEIEFNYSLVLARDGRLIGPVFKSGTNSSTSRDNYPSAPDLLKSVIDGQLRQIGRDIAPYTTYDSRTFASESTKDKVLKAEMKNALDMVKAGSYSTALELYLGIYDEYKSVAAAYNASILHELVNDTWTAASYMQNVYNETGNPKALEALARLNKILKDQAVLASDYGDKKDQTERVAAFANEEIKKVLPKNARVWIYNNAVRNPITTAVADNITSDFIKNKIIVVDRQNMKLIEAEQKLQMSGYVSDNDFVSIGNATGANTIVVLDIIGTGASRRLQVRVLNLEKGIPLMQSDTSEKWRI